MVLCRSVLYIVGRALLPTGSRVTNPIRPNAVVGPPDYAVQMLHAQLFNVNTTCHNIPLGGSGSSVTPAVPRPLGSTFSQSDSGIISIPTPFRCFNGS